MRRLLNEAKGCRLPPIATTFRPLKRRGISESWRALSTRTVGCFVCINEGSEDNGTPSHDRGRSEWRPPAGDLVGYVGQASEERVPGTFRVWV